MLESKDWRSCLHLGRYALEIYHELPRSLACKVAKQVLTVVSLYIHMLECRSREEIATACVRERCEIVERVPLRDGKVALYRV